MKYTYTLQNLNCAHCAGKIEKKIAETDGYENVSFNFATKLLNFYSEKENSLAEIQAICDSIEDGVTVVDSTVKTEKAEKKFDIANLLLVISIVFGIAAVAAHMMLKAQWSEYIIFALSLVAALLSGYRTFIKGFKNVVKLRFDETTLMTIAVIAAFCLGEFVEAAMVSILFSIGEFIEDRAVDSSRRDIEKLSRIRPDNATILSNGKELEVSAESVAIGCDILVKPHERIPIDGVVTDGYSTLDTSALTGESLPVSVTTGSEVMSGAINGERPLLIKTTKKFSDSTATRILKLVEDAAAQKGNNEKFISRFASVYTPVVMILAVLIAVVPPIAGFGTFAEWLYRALAVLVASCPCAIVISVPLAYYSGIGAASRQGVLIKGGKYLEALAEADAFAFDKTGTLTTGSLKIEKVYASAEYSEEEVLKLASACELYSTHPIAMAIKKSAPNSSDITLTDYREIAGCGIEAEYKGKKLVCGNERACDKSIPDKFKHANVFLIYDGELIGAIEISDTVRSEAKSVLKELKKLGAKHLVMLTGDAEKNAEQISRQLALSEYKAELMPADKLSAVEQMKSGKRKVCFVGDGINDAPVLSASDCGIAMGLGSEAAIEASDAVLSSGSLDNLPKAVKTARKAINTVKANVIFSLAVKAAVIILAAMGLTAMWMSVLADTGVCVVCVLYTARLLREK